MIIFMVISVISAVISVDFGDFGESCYRCSTISYLFANISYWSRYCSFSNIGIKHGFPCINVSLVPREMLKTEAEGRGFQQIPRDLANVNALENNV